MLIRPPPLSEHLRQRVIAAKVIVPVSQVWIPQATADEQRKAALGNVSDDDDDDDDDDSDESEDETVA